MALNNIFRFQKLDVYQIAKELVKESYMVTKGFPDYERYALIPQINRAAISIPSNIAEGISRKSKKDQLHFLNMSYASLMELVCQVEISQKLGYISEEEADSFNLKARNLAVKTTNFMKSIEARSLD